MLSWVITHKRSFHKQGVTMYLVISKKEDVFFGGFEYGLFDKEFPSTEEALVWVRERMSREAQARLTSDYPMFQSFTTYKIFSEVQIESIEKDPEDIWDQGIEP